MIAASDIHKASADVWARLAAPIAAGSIFWRRDGEPVARDGKFFVRFVACVDANTVRERLDAVVPGEWDLTLAQLPAVVTTDPRESTCSFKASLQVLGVVREDVGMGRDYKQAATDAFKRAAVRFGIAHELYSYGANWVESTATESMRSHWRIRHQSSLEKTERSRGKRPMQLRPRKDLG